MLVASSCLSIETDADMTSDNLCEHAQSPEPVNFAKAFSAAYEGISLSDAQLPENRMKSMKQLLESASQNGT